MFERAPRLGRAGAAGALAGALTLHDFEEGVGYWALRPEIVRRTGWDLPDPAAFAAALIAVTVAGAALLAWSAIGRETGLKRGAQTLVAWILLLNVLAPHVPAAIWLGGYAPGVATAVLVNLPLCAWLILSRRGGAGGGTERLER